MYVHISIGWLICASNLLRWESRSQIRNASFLLESLPASYEGSVNTIGATNDPGGESFVAVTQKPKCKNRDIECFNCKKRSHVKPNCWEEGGGKEGQGPKKSGAKAGAITAETQSQDVKAWVMAQQTTMQRSPIRVKRTRGRGL